MEPISLVLGAAVGAGIGAVLLLVNRKNTAMQGVELQQTRRELDKLKGETSGELKRLKQAETDTRRQISAAREKAAELERSMEEQLKEASRLKLALREAEGARDQALEQANARQTARQQAEGRLRQAEKLATESAQQLDELAAKLKQAEEAQADLNETLRRRGDEIKRLRAELDAGDRRSGSDLESSVDIFADSDGSLKSILDTLLDREAQEAAVLADANGIVVASSGEQTLRDGIAAVAQLLTSTSASFEGMVPFAKLQAFSVKDSESVVLSGRSFEAAGERISLATLGSRSPSDRTLDGAMASLSAALE